MHAIKRERFEALVAYTRVSNILAQELEWYESDDKILLATIVIDYENQFSVVIFGRDDKQRYRCIDVIPSFKRQAYAKKSMLRKTKKILENNSNTFPQGDEKGNNINLFEPLIKTSTKLNPHFEEVRNHNTFSSAREIITEIMNYYVDIDGNFIEQFQTTGFDSRLWELYLFAYLTEESFDLDRTHNAPDFLVAKGDRKIAIEAVTVQATQNKKETTSILKDNEQNIVRSRDYMSIKFGSALYSKLKKEYWKKEHVNNNPLIFAIADFHEEQSMLWTSPALISYLYGIEHDHSCSEDGTLAIKRIKIDVHKYQDKKIPSGFFFTKDAEHISAVLFSATGTITKFTRMGRIAGFGDLSIKSVYFGTCHDHNPNAALPNRFFFEINEEYKETWGTGVSIFHNPQALHPISPDIFPSVAHHHYIDGQIVSTIPSFHPYSGQTIDIEVTK